MTDTFTAGRHARRGRSLASPLAGIGLWLRQRRTTATLARLGDHTLRDIGFERDPFGHMTRIDGTAAAERSRSLTVQLRRADDNIQPERFSTMTTNLDTVRRFLAGTHSNTLADVDVIDSTVTASIACHGFPGFPAGELRGRESYKAFFRTFQASFSEMDFTIVALYEAAGFVSAHWSCEATFSGDFAGIAADRRRVHFDGVAVYRMENGLIAETWLGFPVPMLMAQLPAPMAQAA
jgi:uncharacterized protein YjiS (DUF1127 family)/predicted ester cyclase